MFLLDTDFCIDVLRQRPNAITWLKQQSLAEISVSAITAAELLHGAQRRPQSALLTTMEFLRPLQIIPFDFKAAEHYGLLRTALEFSGNVIGPNDMLIAATALANSAILITRNTREFNRVAGLRLQTIAS